MNGLSSCPSVALMAPSWLGSRRPRSQSASSSLYLFFLVGSFEEPPVLPVALGLEFVVRNEAQGGRIDAVAQAAGLGRPIVEDSTEVTISMGRADLDAGDPVAGIELLDHIFTFKWNRE